MDTSEAEGPLTADSRTPDDVEAEASALREECQDRLWLRTITPLLALLRADESPRVGYALDQMQIAACERAARILQSDLPGNS